MFKKETTNTTTTTKFIEMRNMQPPFSIFKTNSNANFPYRVYPVTDEEQLSSAMLPDMFTKELLHLLNGFNTIRMRKICVLLHLTDRHTILVSAGKICISLI